MTLFVSRLAPLAAAAILLGASPSPDLAPSSPAPAASASASSASGSAADGVRLPIDWNLTPAEIASTCKEQIADADRRAKAVAAIPPAQQNFTSVVLALEDLSSDLGDRLTAQTNLALLASDAAVRKASLTCSTDVGNFNAELTARPELYRALQQAQASGTATDPADKKLLSLWLVVMQRAGAGLPAAKRKQFVTLSQELNDLTNRFNANVADDQTTILITPAEAAGLKPDFIATLKKRGANYIVPVNESTETPFMTNARSSPVRKRFIIAYDNRAALKNVAILQRGLVVRYQLARLLGYPNWASYILADRMAATPQRVFSFLRDLDKRVLPLARRDRATLAAMKHGKLEAWDAPYYFNELLKTRYAVDRDQIKQYFPTQHTVDAVFAIYSKLLGVTYTRQPAVQTWNPEVVVYDVNDAVTNRYIGTFALDLYPRPGKYEHFANFPMLSVRRQPDGRYRAPFAAIVGNWVRPAAGRPSLLSRGEVQTFFHEFGHAMAAVLATPPYETLSQGFRWDFVEAPSQMLENWAWSPRILKQISSNVTTHQPLPDALISKILATRYVYYDAGIAGQIDLAMTDLTYHTLTPPVDTTAIWARVQRETTPTRMIPGTHPQAAFTHLFGGYDAGYYGYLWSQVYADDMFTAFEQVGLQNPQVGMRYREDILAPARQIEPDVAVRNFLGRPVSSQAFYSAIQKDPLANPAAAQTR